MKKSSKMHISNAGLVSLFMIFAVICMVVLSLLSFSEARRDYTFSSTLAEHNKAYYEAANQAERKIAAVNGELRTGKRPLNSADISFSVKIDDDQAILVVLSPETYPCKIKKYETIRTRQWHGENAAQLMNVER